MPFFRPKRTLAAAMRRIRAGAREMPDGWPKTAKSAENGGGREMQSANALPGGVKTLKPTDS